MGLDDLKKLTTGFIKGWKKGKLKETLQETAELAIDGKIKIAELEETIRQQKDEILRLKGEKGRPKIKPANTNKGLNPPPRKKHKKKNKKADLQIDEEVELDVDPKDLPKDAKKIGSRDIVIQEIEISRRNLKFVIRRYFSPLEGKVIEGVLPAGFKGSQFGPQLRSFCLYQYYKCRTPHKKIIKMLEDWGIEMSAGALSSILNKQDDVFRDDLASAKKAAIKKQSRVYLDDTGARINGVNANTHGLSNDFFTQYETGFSKSRLSTLRALYGKDEYLIDGQAISFVAEKLKRAKITGQLYPLLDQLFTEAELQNRLQGLKKDELDMVKSAGLRSALRQEGKIKFLISDDGTNFNDILPNHQLCWVHEIRKYKKLPVYHEILVKEVDQVVKSWQRLYKKMRRYGRCPDQDLRLEIRSEFDQIVEKRSRIEVLDKQLELTKKNKQRLLLFLRYPQLPLHSNMIERDLRERVIKRKISLQNRSIEGVKAWDLMLSLASTCQKLKLSFWRYLEDRVSQREAIPYLGKLVISHS